MCYMDKNRLDEGNGTHLEREVLVCRFQRRGQVVQEHV